MTPWLRPSSVASWPQKCPGCGEQITEGDEIGLIEGEWCCAYCVEAAEQDGGADE